MTRKSDRFPPLHDHMPPEDAFPSFAATVVVWSGFCILIGLVAGIIATMWFMV